MSPSGILASIVLAAAPPAFTIEDLGDLGGELANAFAINEAGDVVGQAENASLGTNAFLWQNGVMTGLGSFIGPTGYGRANGISDNGIVVGTAATPAGAGFSSRAFVWTEADGMQNLGPSLDYWSTATGVNSAGQVIGHKSGPSGDAFVWTAASGPSFFSLPGAPAGYYDEPTGINENGLVAGYAWNANLDLMGYVYDSTTGAITELPGLDDSNTTGGINLHGEVAGSSAEPNNLRWACYWTSDGTLVQIPVLDSPHFLVYGDANDINDSRWIVGSDSALAGTGHRAVSWLWIDGEKWALDDLLVGVEPGEWEIWWAFDINNAGQIVGIAIHDGVPGRAYRMTPVPRTCPADFDGNGAIDVDDLLALLAAWGQPGGPYDLDGNGTVGVNDLLLLLTAWGPCDTLPDGACCLPAGECTITDEVSCNIARGEWNGDGSGCAAVMCAVPPLGDLIENPIIVPDVPYSTVGDTSGLSDDYDEWCPFPGSTSPDAVYAYTPASDVTITVSLCGDSAYDTKLYIYADVEGNLVDCNDDACTTATVPIPVVSEIVGASLAAGSTYYIVVDGYGGDAGAYTLDITAP